MDVRQCKKCRKLFNYIRSPFCSDCQTAIDADQLQISEFLHDHRGAGVEEIALETGVERSIILYLIREGRLKLSSESPIHCERCETPILTGRYCRGCRESLHSELSHLENQLAQAVQRPPMGVPVKSQKNGRAIAQTPADSASTNPALSNHDRLSGR